MPIKNKNKINSKILPGFTLIELLVVIAIIGLLSTIVLVAIGGIREKARDSKRVAALKQIRTALELYYDAHIHYPPQSKDGQIDGTTVPGDIDDILKDYMSGLSKDPLHSGTYYFGYQGKVSCNGSYVALIYAKTMETDNYNNQTVVCPINGPGEYIVILGEYAPAT